MFKLFCLKALRLVVLTLILVHIALGSALAQGIQSPKEASPSSAEMINKPEEILPARPKPTANERTTNTPSTKVPEKVSPTRTSNTARPEDPYSKYYDAIKKFDEELYGKGG